MTGENPLTVEVNELHRWVQMANEQEINDFDWMGVASAEFRELVFAVD